MSADKVTTELLFKPARPNSQIKSIRKMGNYLLSLEYGLGIHISDYSDKRFPLKLGFYQIPACVDFEVLNNKVYANNLRDFIIIDFTDVLNPIVINRKTNVFDITIKAPDGSLVYPDMEKLPPNTVIISYERL